MLLAYATFSPATELTRFYIIPLHFINPFTSSSAITSTIFFSSFSLFLSLSLFFFFSENKPKKKCCGNLVIFSYQELGFHQFKASKSLSLSSSSFPSYLSVSLPEVLLGRCPNPEPKSRPEPPFPDLPVFLFSARFSLSPAL